MYARTSVTDKGSKTRTMHSINHLTTLSRGTSKAVAINLKLPMSVLDMSSLFASMELLLELILDRTSVTSKLSAASSLRSL